MATMWIKGKRSGGWRPATDQERDEVELDMRSERHSPNEFAAIRRKLRSLEKRVEELEDQLQQGRER